MEYLKYSKLTEKRCVSFSSIEVRGYGLALGDNPSCSRGPAITLNWDYNEEIKDLSVDEYENLRQNTRRSKNEMILPCILREAIIMSNGYSRLEIKESLNECKRIKKSRCKTASQTPRQQRTAELLESTKKLLLSGGGSKGGDKGKGKTGLLRRRGSDSRLKNKNASPLPLRRKAASLNDLHTHSSRINEMSSSSFMPVRGILKTL